MKSYALLLLQCFPEAMKRCIHKEEAQLFDLQTKDGPLTSSISFIGSLLEMPNLSSKPPNIHFNKSPEICMLVNDWKALI